MSDKKITVEILRKTFQGKTSKDAYMHACKWLATYILRKDELADSLVYKYERDRNAILPSFTLIVFVEFDEDKMIEGFCNKCKEVYQHFYIANSPGCNECKLMAFNRQMSQKIVIKSEYKKKRLKAYEEHILSLREDDKNDDQ